MKFTIYFLRVVSILSLFYTIIILTFSGIKTSFLSFWVALSVCCMGLSFLLAHLQNKTPKGQTFASILVGLVWLSIIIFCIVEGFIISASLKPAEKNADYVIVLGAQVRGNKPSLTLDKRIETAANYLLENSNSIVICSGGQGEGELITEALAIKKGLLERGIEENRILLEEKSTNTVENLKFCKEMIHDPNAKVVVVTSDFHVYRAKKIAEHIGYNNLSMCPANEFLATTISYYVREFFALTKDRVVGNLR